MRGSAVLLHVLRAFVTWVVVFALVLLVMGMLRRLGTLELVLAFLVSVGLTAFAPGVRERTRSRQSGPMDA